MAEIKRYNERVSRDLIAGEAIILKILEEKEKMNKQELKTAYETRGYRNFDNILKELLNDEIANVTEDNVRLTKYGEGVLATFKKFNRFAYGKL